MWLYILGLLVHMVCFLSVFDVYFHTPLIHGMASEVIEHPASAKRVVLIVADGLRADYLFELVNDTTLSPFLRQVIEKKGTWGISHTQMPTESRPGHVALIGGIYEDPSAIAKGWKENPVEFDSVFNQSFHTWSWGSPDILPMFQKGATPGKVDSFMYSHSDEDFATADASLLDTWVFDKVTQFFHKALTNEQLKRQLMQEKTVFFFHLLGLDTNGHSKKPQSFEYAKNIELVDRGVQNMTKLFHSFYNDSSTAFIFTSDHGMTTWGSHGAGDPSETETPMVAWGAGISTPNDPYNFQTRVLYDPRVETWGLNHVRRSDIRQADIAPLMATLIGVPIPVNSVGCIPIVYLSGSDAYKADALFTNARQMLAHYRKKRAQKEENTLSLFYKPFVHLMPDEEAEIIRSIRMEMKNHQYENAITSSYKLVALCRNGLKYYHNYDRTSLSAVIILCFVGWIVLLVCQILKDYTPIEYIACSTLKGSRRNSKNYTIDICLVSWAASTIFFLIAQNSQWQHYFYYLLPVFLWTLIYKRLEFLMYAWLIIKSTDMVWELAIRFICILAGIEILVFSFFLRPLLSIGLLAIALWPVVLHSMESETDKSLRLCWFGVCILLASFTYLPVIGKEAVYIYVEIGGIVAFVMLSSGLLWCGGELWVVKTLPLVVYIQGGIILTSVYLVHTTAFSIAIKEGLPLGNQVAAWFILGCSLVLPIFGSGYIFGRLVSVSGALLCPFILLSIRHEVFFFIALSVAMFIWLIIEYRLAGEHAQISVLKFAVWKKGSQESSLRHLNWADIRRAFFFLFFVILSFFGTGNMASVNSFDPSFVYCFITVFSPFVMGGLLLFKIFIPFLLVTCFFHAICSLMQVPVKALILVFLVLSDIMAMHFFFLIRTEGSWLDIGKSVSHYVICMVTTIFIIFILKLGEILTTFDGKLTLRSSDGMNGILPNFLRRLHKD